MTRSNSHRAFSRLSEAGALLARRIRVSARGTGAALLLAAPLVLAALAAPTGAMAQVTVSVTSGGDVNEGGTGTFTVTLSGSPSSEVVVTFDYLNPGGVVDVDPDDSIAPTANFFLAIPGVDYRTNAAPTDRRLVFAAGATGSALTRTISIATIDDAFNEGAEPVGVRFRTSSSGAVALDVGRVFNIRESDPITLTLTGPSTVTEGSDATFTVRLTGGDVLGGMRVTLFAVAGTASGQDFALGSGSYFVDFLTGATGSGREGQVTIATTDDSLPEDDETFTVQLSSHTGLGPVNFSRDPMTVTITDNDQGDPVTVGFESATSAADEGSHVEFDVVLSETLANAVEVDYAVAFGTATVQHFLPSGPIPPGTLSGAVNFPANAIGDDLTQTIRIPTIDDTVANTDRTFTITLTEPAGGFAGGVTLGTATAAGTIRNDDSGDITVADANALEGAPITFTISLASPAAETVTVDYTVSAETGDTASANDFTAASGSVTFISGMTTRDVLVLTASDDLVEGDETFTFSLSEPSGGFPDGVTLATATATGTINDEDAVTLSVSMERGGIEDADGGFPAAFRIGLSGPVGEDVVVDYATSSGTAREDVDFEATSGRVTIPAGDQSRTINVPVIDDQVVEDSEIFTLTVTPVSLPPSVTPGILTATAAVTDDDAVLVVMTSGPAVDEGSSAVFTVTLSNTPGRRVEVDYETFLASDDTAEPEDFTATEGTLIFRRDASGDDLTQTIMVPITDDEAMEDEETFSLRLTEGSGFETGRVMFSQGRDVAKGQIRTSGPIEVSITATTLTGEPANPQGLEEGQQLIFTARLSRASSENVRVIRRVIPLTSTTLPYTSENGVVVNAAADVSDVTPSSRFTGSGSFDFAAGSTGAQTFALTAVDDDIAEEAEGFLAVIEEDPGNPLPPGVVLGGNVQTINGVLRSVATGIIQASDQPVLSIEGGSGSEGGNIDFTVTLSETPAEDVRYSYALTTASGENQASRDDIVSFPAEIRTFTAGATGSALMHSISIQIVDDMRAEPEETFGLELLTDINLGAVGTIQGLPDGVVLGDSEATGTIAASDALTISMPNARGSEEDGSVDFTVNVAGGLIEADLQLAYAASASEADTAEAAVDFSDTQGILTFAAGASGDDRSQTITVPVVNDNLAEDAETFTVVLIPVGDLPTGVSLQGGGEMLSATGTINANDRTMVTVADVSAPEEDGAIVFTVTLSSRPQSDLEVTYATTAGTAADTGDRPDFTPPADGSMLAFEAETATLTQTISVPVTDDIYAEGDETFTLTLTEGSAFPTTAAITMATATGTIETSDAATITVTSVTGFEPDPEFGRSGNPVEFTLTLSESPAEQVRINYETVLDSGAGAAEQDDFVALESTRITFPAGAEGDDLTVEIPVTVVDDSEAEGQETFILRLSPETALPPGVTLPETDVTGTIGVSDATEISITSDAATSADAAAEGEAVTFTVALSNSPPAEIQVNYAAEVASGDTATADDFADTSGTLTFAAATTTLTQTFTVAVTDDSLAESEETFTVALTEGTGFPASGVLFGAMTAQGTIGANDAATIALSPSPAGELAEGETLTFTAALTGGAVQDDLNIPWSVLAASDTAVAADFTATSGMVTIAAGETSGTFMVAAEDDDLPEDEETFTVALNAPPASAIELPPNVTLGTSTAAGTIPASDVVEVSIAGGSANEGEDVTFTVTLSRSPVEAVTVGYATSVETGDTAAQADFTDTSGTLTFAAGATTLMQTFTVAVADDDDAEGAETFTATLTEGAAGFPAGVALTTATATGTINASDGTSVSITGGSADEGGNITFTVTLSGAPLAPITVNYATSVESDDTAVQADFAAASGTLTFAAATTTLEQTFTVAAVDDDLAEGDETFTATLAAPDGGLPDSVFLGTETAKGTINESDAATVSIAAVAAGDEGGNITFMVTLSGSPGAAVMVDYATSVETDDTAVQADFTDTSGTLTFAAGASGAALTQEFTVPVADDDLAESRETFTVTLTEAGVGGFPAGVTLDTATVKGTINASDAITVSITGGRGDEPGNVTFTVTLSESPGAAVMVDYATSVESDDTAVQADFTDTSGTLTFASGATGAALTQTFMVPVVDDDLAEGAETFTATLTEGGSGFPTGVVLGTDTAKGTINVSDAAEVSIAAASGDEGGTITFTVTLSESPPAGFTVDYATSVETEDTAVQADFTDTSGTLTFASGASGAALAQTFTVALVDDGLVEVAETFTVTLTEGGGGFPEGVVLGTATVQGTITANGMATVSIAAGEGREGENVTFEVTLSATVVEHDVSVDFATSVESEDTATQDDFTAASGTLTFMAGTTTLTQTIEVAAIRDDIEEEEGETFTVTLTEGGGGFPDRVTLVTTTAQGTIRDADDTESRLSRVNKAVLPRVVEAMASSTLSAIVGRIDAAASGVPTSRLSGMPGKSSLLQALKSSEHALEDGTTDLEQVVGQSSFMLSLNASENGAGGVGDFAVWGSGDYRSLAGPDDSAVDWDGDIFSFHLGADTRLAPDLLAGVSVSRSSGSFDYTHRDDSGATKGTYDSVMNSVHPYVSWSASNDLGLWATIGYGEGEIEIKEEDDTHQSDIEMKSAAVGMSHKLLSDDRLIPGGTASLKLKGEGGITRVDVEGAGDIIADNVNVGRFRVAVEGSYDCLPGSPDECVTPSLELGLRHDSGDVEGAGLGLEAGGALRYASRDTGLTVEGRGRMLVFDQNGRQDWGVGGLVRFDPGANGRGLSFSLTPAFGDVTSNVNQLYNQRSFDRNAEDADPTARLDTEIGYGFAGLDGVVTPYTGVSLAGEGSRSYRVGSRFVLGSSLSVSLEGMRRERDAAESDHSVMMRGRLHW